MATTEQAREVEEVSYQIYGLLTARDRAVQGAVCADILSLWLAGHSVPGDEKATIEVREAILKAHI